MTPEWGWKAFAREEDYGRRTRLYLRRLNGDGSYDVLHGELLMTRVQADAVLPDGVEGLFLPEGAWEAVLELVRPKKDTGEVQWLTEALDLERSRIDRVLGSFLRDIT